MTADRLAAIAAVAAYLGVAVVMWVQVYRWLYRSKRRDFPSLAWDDSDRLFACAWGGVVSILWPLFAPFFGLRWAIKRAAARGLFDRLEDS